MQIYSNSMKWFKNTSEAVITTLYEIFNQKNQADKSIQKLLKTQKKWGSRDRKFVAKVLYDIVRWKRLYEYVTNSEIKTIEGKWNILTAWSKQNKVPIPSWFQHTIDDKKINFSQSLPFSIEQSIPDWLERSGKKQMGKEKFEREIKALNIEAPTVIRVNILKTTINKLQKKLALQNIKTIFKKKYPHALFIEGKPKLTHLECYKKGWFEIQDASSQQVAFFVNPKPEQTIIDACAGAGGKTLHLASLMKNTGRILAYDIYPEKIEELKKRAKRNGITNIEEAQVITNKIIEKNKNLADILLLDVPCSSLGTLKRKPGLKWELNPNKLKNIQTIQKNILKIYPKMIKTGGYLIYVTCSILPEENEKNIKSFLEQNKNFIFVEQKHISPSESGNDGFYMAKLKKIN